MSETMSDKISEKASEKASEKTSETLSETMTNRERFVRTMNFQPTDRMPRVEWAPFWDLTLNRWMQEGLDTKGCQYAEIGQHLGMDLLSQTCIPLRIEQCPGPAHFGGPVMIDEKDYQKVKPFLYPADAAERVRYQLEYYLDRHNSGEMVSWITYEGFFWFPRTLFGIENHFYAFFDYPELMHQINQDLADFIIASLDSICEIDCPDFMTFAEDMSYNHGPMLSKELFDEFLLPYYKQVIPAIHKKGIKVIVDSDGDVTEMIPWLIDAGVDGVLPLERQAGVDVTLLKSRYPDFILIGAYNKMVMKSGETAMRNEFERLLPAIRKGGVVASVDHQTPPDVSLENYKIYISLLKEYSEKAK